MTKYTVKAEVDNVIQNEDGTFDYNQKVVSMKWDERKGHTQSGTGPGEFGPDYSDRKKYHQGELRRHLSEWIHAPDDGRIKKKDHEGYEYESDSNTGRTHKD